ncbi:MAG: hypothetical protein KAU94_04860 [Verrucomicrobia bacterium]|nr:hypothetical protein [Verrucomicrobiota bacterium]
MEWTDDATQELESTLARLRASLNPQEVDPDEVAEDIKMRIEAELAKNNGSVVTAEGVRTAAARIGVQEIVPDEENKRFVFDLEKPLRRRGRIAMGCFWFAGIILPLLALGTEAIAHLCLEAGLSDPLPTPFHVVLIALVPLSNFLGWRAITQGRCIPRKWLGLLLGATTSIAAFYTLMFAIVTPFAIMGFAGIIFYGIGLLSFLPLAPLLSLCATLRMRILLKRHFGQSLPLYRRGLLAGLAAIVLVSVPMYLTKAGLTMAASDSPETQLKGIKLLRLAGDDVLLNRACYWSGSGQTDPIAWLISRGEYVPPDEARDIYFRVTGTAFNTVASPTLGIRTRRNPGNEFDWDPEQGGDVVAGRLKGLSMADSRIDGTVNADAATAYLEWTMVFRNDWQTEREARAQIALPPGAVVSRLTLWIDGEEREAAFGGRSQVKQAYKKVVRRRRDPVLVTTCGPDRVLMQCYPVPANGEMKIRIGITAPMDLLTINDRRMRLPHMLERNFRIPEGVNHSVWIEDHGIFNLTDAELNSPDAHIRAESDITACWAPYGNATVSQLIHKAKVPESREFTIVLDTSFGMETQFGKIAEALEKLTADKAVAIWIATDGEPQKIGFQSIRMLKARGGKDNSQALRKALTGSADCVIWIHAPQKWDLGSTEILRQAMERIHGKTLYDIQVTSGSNRLIEKMDNLAGFHTVPRYGSLDEDLQRLVSMLSGKHPSWERIRAAVSDQDPNEVQADEHLARLYALDIIRRDLTDGKPGNDTAMKLALKYHLVTPISGAVVLETQKQYKEAGLEPVDSSNVPNVPEPGVLALLVLAALLLFFGKRFGRRIRLALGFTM